MEEHAMLKKLNHRTWCCICCLMLACALFFCTASLSAQAIESCDVSVIGVTIKDNHVYTTFYCQSETKPGAVDTISYYMDGARIMTESNCSLTWVGDKAQLASQSTVTARSGNLTVVVDIASDVSAGNNNRTVVLRNNMPAPPVLGEEEQPGETTPPHNHSYSVSQVVAPGCTTGGYTIYKCSCGDSYTGNATSATGHSWGNWVVTKQPTTSAEGEETRKCGSCGATETQAVDKLPSGSETVDAQPVENLAVFSAPANFVTLTWDAPASGTAPTAYRIYNGSNLVATVDAKNLSYTVTGLSATTSYTFKVVAMVNDTASAAKQVTVTTAAASNNNGKADLVVTDIRFSPENPKVGDSVVFTAVVKNQGNKATPEGTIVGIRFGINGVEGTPFTWCDNYTKSVAPGESVLLTVNGGSSGASWTPGSTGTYSIHAWVDDQNRIEESDTNNNDDYSESITVSEQTPIELPSGLTSGTSTVYTVENSYSGGAAGEINNRKSAGIVVTVNNKNSFVFDAPVNNSHLYFTPVYSTTPTTIVEMASEGSNAAIVRVALTRDVSSVIVRPLSADIKPTIKTGSNGQKYVEFTVTKWGSYSVEFNGTTEKALQLFVNPHYYDGQHGNGYMGLGRAEYANALGVGSVYGSGVYCSTGNYNTPALYVGSGAYIRGITLLNYHQGGPHWNVEIRDSSNIHFEYFHIVAQSQNSDGISIQSSSHIYVDNCYLRTWDDGIVLKIYTGNDTTNVYVNNTVFWTDLAQSMEIGAETNKYGANGSPRIADVEFNNIDIIHACHKPAISIHNMDNATVENITWKNVVIEDASMGNNLPRSGYDSGTNISYSFDDGWPILVDITNVKGGEVYGTAGSWTSVGARGTIRNVTLENIQVLSWKNQNTGLAANVKPGVRIANSNAGGTITGITINGLRYLESNGTVTTISSVSDLTSKTNSPFTVDTMTYGSNPTIHVGNQTFWPENNLTISTSASAVLRNPREYLVTIG